MRTHHLISDESGFLEGGCIGDTKFYMAKSEILTIRSTVSSLLVMWVLVCRLLAEYINVLDCIA